MDKFKKDIQHKFNQRDIQPTDEAWGKITRELAAFRTSKTKVFWLSSGIAAGFIGLLVLLSPLYLSININTPVANSEENETQDVVVERQSVTSINQLKSNGVQILPVKFSKPTKFAIQSPKPFSNKNLTANHLKVKTLLAEVEMELENERFSQQKMDEVSDLLAQARTNLSSKKEQQLLDQISAKSLLAEVDMENTDSFKDKIWKLIEVNYRELKSSLSAR